MSIEVLSAGTLSSLIAVGIIEMYYLARRRYTQRALKRILPHRGQRTTIVVPAFPARNPDEGPGLSLDDALALVYILAALRRIGVEGEVYSSEDEMRYAGSGLICIGGPQTNRITKQFMLDHCSGFHLVLDPESTEERRVHRCGDKRIVTSHDKSFWNITWLSGEVAGREDDTLLVWGHYGSDTTAAAYYLTARAQKLAKSASRNRGIFLLGARNPHLGHMFVPHEPEDLTAVAMITK